MGNPRKANGNARRKAVAWLRSQGLECAECHRPIDYSLPARDPMAFEVDECVPVSRYWCRAWNDQRKCWAGPYQSAEQAALAVENLRATHRICNERKGNALPGERKAANAAIVKSRSSY